MSVLLLQIFFCLFYSGSVFANNFWEPIQSANAAKTTFVFWWQGDADHFVPELSTKSTGDHLKRADSLEVQRTLLLAAKCTECNVVILHNQRGGAHWYTSNQPWATYLYTFSRGKLVLERHTPNINAANPNTISDLLKFSESTFPLSSIHFIYRGHAFSPEYNPQISNGIAPFAFGFPESQFGITEFIEGIRKAQLHQTLSSVTLAACHMADLSLASRLATFSKYMIATQVDVLETLSTSFRFDFLVNFLGNRTDKEIATQIASHLMMAFDKASYNDEMMMESPASMIDLSGMEEIEQNFYGLIRNYIQENDLTFSQVNKGISTHYIKELYRQGKSQEKINRMILKLQIPVDGFYDCIKALESLKRSSQNPDIFELSAQLILALKSKIQIFNSSPASQNTGLGFRLLDIEPLNSSQ